MGLSFFLLGADTSGLHSTGECYTRQGFPSLTRSLDFYPDSSLLLERNLSYPNPRDCHIAAQLLNQDFLMLLDLLRGRYFLELLHTKASALTLVAALESGHLCLAGSCVCSTATGIPHAS